jgi:hypothetical protein
MKIKKIKIQK